MNRAAIRCADRCPSRQRGAVGVLFAISLVALLTCLTLAIDIGRLYTAQRDLQRAANIAALDAAKVTNGCMGFVDNADAQSVANAEVMASIVRNRADGFLPSTGGVLLGRLTYGGGVRSFTALGGADSGTRTAVQVRLERPTPARLLPLGSGGLMVAQAAADSRPQATIRVGSGLASISDGLLSDLLGALFDDPALAISAVDYRGLLDASIRLDDLALELGLASVEDLLDASTSLSLQSLLTAIDGLVEEDDGNLLETLAATPGALAAVTPGQVIAVPLGLSGTGNNSLVNAGELIMSLAQSARQGSAISLPLNAGVPGLTQVTATIGIIQPAQQKVFLPGEVPNPMDPNDYASTAQVNVQLSAKLAVGALVVDVPLYLTAAKATAALESVRCARRGQDQHLVYVDTTTSIAELGLGRYSNINAPAPTVTPANLITVSALGIPIATITASTQVPLGEAQDQPLEFEGPYSKTETLSTRLPNALNDGLGDLAGALNLSVTLLGVDLPLVNEAGLANGVVTLVQPALSSALNLLDPVLTGLLEGLGVSVGNADVEVVSLQPVNDPDGGDPLLATEQLSLQAFLFTH